MEIFIEGKKSALIADEKIIERFFSGFLIIFGIFNEIWGFFDDFIIIKFSRDQSV